MSLDLLSYWKILRLIAIFIGMCLFIKSNLIDMKAIKPTATYKGSNEINGYKSNRECREKNGGSAERGAHTHTPESLENF